MAQQSKQLNWRWIWIGAAVGLVGLFFVVRSLTRERLQVRTAEVSRQDLVSVLSTNGRVEPQQNFELHSPLATTVRAVYVKPGDPVTAGKVLAVLDDSDTRARVATAESGLKSALAALDATTQNGTLEQRQAAAADVTRARLDRDQAQRDLDAIVRLNATGAASASEVAAAKHRLAGAMASLEAAEMSARNRFSAADMTRAKAAVADAEANLAAARATQDRMTLRAAVAGTVYSMDAQPTSFVDSGKLLMQVADLKRMRVRAYFDEPDLGKIAEGQPVTVTWEARPGHTWEGHIERIPSSVTVYGTRNVGEVLIALDNSDGELLPNTSVKVTVTTSNQANMLAIPREALRMEGGQHYVYRIVNSELKRTPVTTGTFTTTQVGILSGLNAGDWVATGTISGQPLQQGVPVKEVR
jgi:HlyD family secretion protein